MRKSAFVPNWIAVVLVAMAFIAASPAIAANSGITYQGRILKPDGSPLAGANVQFRLQIRTPNANNCLMYEEMQLLDMRNSQGQFALTMNDGSGSRTDSTMLGLDRIFSNASGTANNLTFDPATCASGNSYSPSAGDGRNFVVLFKDETMSSWEPMPSQRLNYVPFAFEAKQVEGFTPQSLVRVQETDGTLGNISPLSNDMYAELLAVINGSSTQYQRAGQLNGANVPSMTSGQVLGWNGSAWTSVNPLMGVQTFAKTTLPACNPGEFLRDDGSGNLVCASVTGASGGTVTSVNTGSGLTGGGFTTTGTISIAAGGVVTSHLADSSVSTLKLADGAVATIKIADGAVTLIKLAAGSVDSSKIVDGSIVGADLNSAINVTTSGTVDAAVLRTPSLLLRNGAFFSGFAAHAALSSDYTLTLPLTAGAPNQVLTTDGSGNLTWTTPSGTGLSALTGDVSASGSGSVVATVNSVGGSTAALVHSAELLANAATDSNTASTLVRRDSLGNFSATGMTGSGISTFAGQVGIGVTAPNANAKLHIEKPSGSTWSFLTNTSGMTNWSGFWTDASNNFGVAARNASGTQTVFMNSSGASYINGGNLGIGTSSPTDKLTVSGGSALIDTPAADTLTNALTLMNSNNSATPGVGLSLTPINSNMSATISNNYSNGHLDFRISARDGAAATTRTRYGIFSTAGGTDVYQYWNRGDGTEAMRLNHAGKLGLGVTSPTATLQIAPSTNAAGSAPLKFTAGPVMTTPEDGAVEFDGSNLFITTGGLRRVIPSTTASNDFSNVGSISGSGALTVAAGGTNQNLTLSGSGSGAVTTSSQLTVTNAAASTSPTTGAAVVSGGLGVGGAINAAGSIATAGNLSVGATGAPWGKLHVETNGTSVDQALVLRNNGNSVGRGSSIQFANDTGQLARIYSVETATDVSGDLRFDTTWASSIVNAMTIKSNGNVGIGTTTPNYFGANPNARVLTIAGNGASNFANGRVELANLMPQGSLGPGVDAGWFAWTMPNNGGDSTDSFLGHIRASLSGAGGPDGFGSDIYFGTKADNGGTADQLVIKNDGKVGIGNMNPSAKLHLATGTAVAGTAPLKMTSGVLLATPEDGAMEYASSNLYYTIGATRYVIPLNTAAGNYSNVSNINNVGGAITMTPAAGNSVVINQSTASLNSTSGALVVSGGVGVAGTINSAGAINAAGSISAGANAYLPQIYGSNTASGNIRIDGTEHATKGNVLLASAGGNVGLGTSSPTSKLDIYTTQTALTGTSDVLTRIHANSMDNLGAVNPVLLKVDTTFGNVPTGKLIEASNNNGTFDVVNSIDSFARVYSGTYQSPVTGNDPKSMFGTSFNGVANDYATPLTGNAVNLNVTSWSGGTPSYWNVYGVPVKIRNASGAASYAFYADVAGATNNWAFYGASGKSFFADPVGIGTTSPTQPLDVAGGYADGMRVRGPAGDNNWLGGVAITNFANTISAGISGSTGGLFFNYNGEKMRLTPDGKLGVGTTQPVAPVDASAAAQALPAPIQSDVTNSAYGIGFNNAAGGGYVPGLTWYAKDNYASKPRAAVWLRSGGTGSSINFGTSNDFSVGVTNTALTIDESGDLQLGNKLRVGLYSQGKADVQVPVQATSAGVQQLSANGAFSVASSGDGYVPGLNWYNFNNHNSHPRASIWMRENGGTSSMYFGTTNSPGTGVNNTALMIDPTGKLGVGTTSPSYALDVADSATSQLRVTSNAFPGGSAGISFTTPAYNSLTVPERARIAYVDSGVNWDGSLQFMVGDNTATERMRISNSGNVGIGVTAPAYKLDIAGDENISGCYRSNGSVLGGTCVSDERLKTDIKPFSLGLEALLQISPKYYKYNGLAETHVSGKPEMGVLAQDVEKKAPELIVKKMVKLRPDDKAPTEIKQVNYTGFIYVLMNSVKELYALWRAESAEIHRGLASTNDQLVKTQAEVERLNQENRQLRAYLCAKDPTAPICH